MKTEQEKQSTIIANRIGEAQQQLRDVEAAQGALQDEKAHVLATPKLDTALLLKLEQKETELVGQSAHLHKRIPLLEQQQEAAEAGEARTRIDEIAVRMGHIKKEVDPELAAFNAAGQALTSACEKLTALWGEADDITEEMEYLHERYDVPRRELANPARLPTLEDSTTRIFASLRQYWLRVNHGRSEWARKSEEWEKEQRRREQEREDAQRAVATAQPVRPAVVRFN